MKTSFVNFCKRNLALLRFGAISSLEYRANFLIDVIVQPLLSGTLELLVWSTIFAVGAYSEIGGYTRENYLAYALWAAFIARITVSWMYEFRMVTEIDTGTVNSLLVRPMSFYQYYLSQFMGYKLLTTFVSLFIPVGLSFALKLPLHLDRLPAVLCLVLYYLILVHSLSFMVSCFAFFFNRVYSLTIAKNLFIMTMTGEMVPLDLMPNGIRELFLKLPFSSAAYRPVAYLTGRIDAGTFYQGYLSVTVTIVLIYFVGQVLWHQGLRRYSGTGA